MCVYVYLTKYDIQQILCILMKKILLLQSFHEQDRFRN